MGRGSFSSDASFAVRLGGGPFEVREMIIGAVAIDVDDVGKVVGVRDKGFCHEAMAIALAVERCYLLAYSQWQNHWAL